MTALTAARLSELFDNLRSAAHDWRKASVDLALVPLTEIEAKNAALANASGAYALAWDDAQQAVARLKRAEESSEIVASLERENAYFRRHARTEATS